MAFEFRSHRRLLSVIVYGSAYIVLYIVLLALLIVTPADAIERSVRTRQTWNIWVLTAGYVVTILIVTFVFFTRLYINKTELAAIPKGWLPIQKGDVRSAVHKMIAAGLSRSAVISYAARPRLRPDRGGEDEYEAGQDEAARAREKLALEDSGMSPEETAVVLPPYKAVWGEIEHYGWGSPYALDLPNLQYSSVISELPNLIEGKALTLAPRDPTSQTDPPTLDPDAVALLQRTATMSLRDYIVHLANLDVLEVDATTTQFLSQYEYARFSTRPISNTRFKELMHLFAEILRAMEPFNPDVLDGGMEASDMTSSESQTDFEARMEELKQPGTPRSNASFVEPAPSISSSTLRRTRRRESSTSWVQWRTAPNSLRSRLTGAVSMSRKSSSYSMTPSRHRPLPSEPSSASLRSRVSASSGSVIRLATRHDSTDLPYIISLRDTT